MNPDKSVPVKYVLQNNEEFESIVNIYSYSERSIAIQSSEHFGKSFTDELIKMNGRFNAKLKIGSGWVFSNNRRTDLEDFFKKINNKEIKGIIPKIYPKSNVGPTGPVSSEPDIVSNFKNLFTSLGNKNSGVEVYIGPDQTFIYGQIASVEDTVKKMNKTIFVQFSTATKSIVMCIP
jgi:hypothetical protein